jgi:hypothetical protein
MYFNNYVSNYERVPLLLTGSSIPSESIMPQYMGQWIYFRQDNPFNNKSLYYDSNIQRQYDYNNIIKGELPEFTGQLSQYLGKDNLQVLLPYRNRTNNNSYGNYWGLLTKDGDNLTYSSYNLINNESQYNNVENFYIYKNIDSSNNNYILKYEHLLNDNLYNSENKINYLSENISISEFVKNLSKSNLNYYNGAFLVPELLSKNQIICSEKNKNQYEVLEVGKSLSIPLLFEYFLVPNDNSSKISISKTLAFDIKTSLNKDPEHYILTVTAKYDYSQTVASTQTYSTLVDGLKSI